jgi:hypothetical protein
MENTSPDPEKSGLKEVSFRYIKSNFFRVVHADGVHGGPSPELNIHMQFFNQRNPIPVRVVHEINENGTLGQEVVEKREGEEKGSIIREVEVDVVMDVENAESFAKWLLQKATELKQRKQKRALGETQHGRP